MRYSHIVIQKYDDNYGDIEAQRLVVTEIYEVGLFIHSEYLRKYIKPGSRVLEIGAGTENISKIIATITYQLIVTDISDV
jgi:ubiquinone/menaquinone biosynthesis C-methylase UbiE